LAALGQNIKFAAENYYAKHSFSKDAARELIKQIARENDSSLLLFPHVKQNLLWQAHPQTCTTVVVV
jgi:hypothetical protein